MFTRGMLSTAAAVGLVTSGIAFAGEPTSNTWPQWGGPSRNFVVPASGLAASWPADGPPRLWHRALGDGYSAIVSADGLLFTMYRKEATAEVECVIALDATSGRTVWEHATDAPLFAKPDERWGGQGPNATPLLIGNRLYTVGSRAVLHCFEARTGRVLWKHDLAAECGAVLNATCGYCPSPIAWRDLVIVVAGCATGSESDRTLPDAPPSHTLVAFDQVTGAVRWQSLDHPHAYSSAILVRVGDTDQLVLNTHRGLVGVDPATGALLWHDTARQSAGTPLWNNVDSIFYCALGNEEEGNAGRVVRLTAAGGRTTVEPVWTSRKVNLMLMTPPCVDGRLYCSNERGLLGVDFATGERLWFKRGFGNATCIAAGDKLIILDEYGKLSLATPTADGLNIHGQCQITERYSLTVPTLVGTTLYVRDRKHIMALDLGAAR